VKYFFDNPISYKFAGMLRALGVDAVALRDQYPEATKDVSLFEMLRGRHLVYVSTDTSQMTREHEARALKNAGITALYFGPFFQRMRFWDQAIWLIKRWPRIDGFANGVAPGTCAEIKQNGAALVYPL
jgi:hypothetical protein